MKNILIFLLALTLYSCGDNKPDTPKADEVQRLLKSEVDMQAAEVALDSTGVYVLNGLDGKPNLATATRDTTWHLYKPIVDTTTPINKPPVANAGNDQTITLPTSTVTLSGSATDPEGKAITYKWVKLSGGSATITNSTSATTTVTGLTAGSYSFRLGAIDADGGTGTDDVNVTVNSAPVQSGVFQGFGSQTLGGTGKPIVHVTALTPAAMSAAWGSNRTIVFDVSGVIVGWRMPGSGVTNLTIDGTSNPVTFMGSVNNKGTIFAFDGSGFHDIIVKNIRVRGAVGAQDNDGDGINVVNGAYNIVFDHVSSTGNNDGNLDLTSGAHDITVQNCIFGGGLGYGQNAGWWSGTMLIAYSPVKNLSVHHNLFVPKTSGAPGERAPYVHSNGTSSTNTLMVDFRNNAVINWGPYGSGFGYNSAGHFINNYYKSTSNPNRAIDPNADPSGGSGSQFYISGNVSGDGASFPTGKKSSPFNIPTANQVTTQTACDAATFIKANAGCRPLDGVDQALINQLVITNCSGTPPIDPPPTACTGYTYSAWSACVNGQQTRTITGFLPNGCAGNPSASPVLSQSCTVNPPSDGYPGYTEVYSNPFSSASNINSNQLGRGGFSTFGGGSFRSEVRAGDAAISSGWRSEQQYGSTQTPDEGIWEYEVYYENWGSFDGGGHSVQWHPNTGGASANVSLQNYSLRWDVTRAIGSNVTHQSGAPSHQSDRWYKLRWEVKFATGSGGYIRLFVDGVQTYSFTGRTDDGSGQYFKLGQNRWPAGSGNSMQKTSVCYYKNLKVYRKL